MSFVYLDRLNNVTFAYRDFYGKRSLILQQVKNEILISSVQLTRPEDYDTELCSFEIPSNSLLVLTEEEANLIELRSKPSVLRFGDDLTTIVPGNIPQ